jgi:hypothetical protein
MAFTGIGASPFVHSSTVVTAKVVLAAGDRFKSAASIRSNGDYTAQKG